MRNSTFAILLAIGVAMTAAAQEPGTPTATLSDTPKIAATASGTVKVRQAHRFWDSANLRLFSAVAASRGLDYASTRNMLARGREEILLPDDVVNNKAGFVALEAAGTATSIGLSYLLHRTGHHKLERWLSIGHAGVATFGAGRNYALKSFSRAN